MYLDKRSKNIVQYLVYHSNTDNRELMTSFSLSRNQLTYTINKINDWCKENRYPEIKRLRTGHFQVPKNLLNLMDKDETAKNETVIEDYVLSEDERSNLILLMIFSKQGYLSLDHFMIDLNISKNTVMRTINYLRELLPENIQISYNRNEGYVLIGTEWDIRKQIIRTVMTVKRMYNGEHFLKKYIDISESTFLKYHDILENAEQLLNVKFTDDRIEHLPYVLALMAKRIELGHIIQESFHIRNNMLSDTKEFMAASKIFDNWTGIPDQEKLFITLQLLTTNVFSGDLLTEKLSKELFDVVENCLYQFERRACVTLNNKRELKQRLVLHLKPAYYRIKYHLNLKMSVENFHFNEYQTALKGIVYETFQPLQQFIGEVIPDEEFEFISIFVLSGLSEKSDATPKKKAVVICKSGILISQTLHTFLQKIFPEFQFVPPQSLRDFNKLPDDVEIIFSTVPIDGKLPVYLVKPMMTQRELEILRVEVLNDLSVISTKPTKAVSVNNILSIIKKYSTIEQLEQLEEELTQLLYEVNYEEHAASGKSLRDLLQANQVQIVNKVLNYQEAINLASHPLIGEDYINENYVYQMIHNHDFNAPYIVLGEEIAIPHALPEYGVQMLGVSVLFVREGVSFSEEDTIHFLFVIAPVDKEQHIEMLYEIMNLAENQQRLEKMKQAANEKELYQLVIQEAE
ncbi:BglG family transcription antiterminator [Enterococcus sp. BWB1-3]|uniref:BglG family transcription antiterminator n=1 Tax=unclassified Enterococcus TaxID=2608891 RepID=UPI00192211A3|nr:MULTISPECIES: BglG family transcription antiterminator [unclassified Enterococcus]MBL1229103.1 BglG family transcription antiterminator [Enterococcus sp. BWB1-3]MCB5953482.1 BglG family transcription antiterminator [Enterococcus sp. CWB-B31]